MLIFKKLFRYLVMAMGVMREALSNNRQTLPGKRADCAQVTRGVCMNVGL